MFRNFSLSSSKKTRSKYFQFSLFILILGIIFVPNDVFAQESISPSYTEFYWKAYNYDTDKDESAVYPLAPGTWTDFGTSSSVFGLLNLGSFLNYEQRSGDYSARITFYINTTTETFYTESLGCGAWSSDVSNASCNIVNSNYKDYIWTYVVDYRWTNSSGFIQLTLNFISNGLFPNSTRFMYQIDSFIYQPSDTSIIVDQNETIINQNQTIIQNGQQTNDKLDNIDGTLKDDNVDDATGSGRDFFDNFKLEDNGGISSIVTLPLRVIRGLISGENNCSALNFTLFEKDMYFPGGCLMWDEVSSANETLYQTIICGFFGYILLTMLYKDIEDLKNPNKEEVSTLDL